ncbi:hypothetical protein ACQ86G_18265 [Roseateles chitinivorans]|uniref:hypothetical protein n=1 Tax=Roseateles chitinivorans TaxID=2917965 RepID=UPI003D67E46B
MALSLKKILAFMPGGFLVTLSDVEIDIEDQNQLRLNADGWLVDFDKRSQRVSYAGRLLTVFSAVECIDIQHFVNGKRFEWWVLCLRLNGGRTRSIGRSIDGAQISIVAARAATAMGKKVCVTQRVGVL